MLPAWTLALVPLNLQFVLRYLHQSLLPHSR
jgi:hypothetical protein